MKIAIVYDMHYPFSIGGAEYRNFSLAQNLVLKGHEVHLFGVKMWKDSKTKKITNNFYMHGVSKYKSKYNFSGKRRVFEPIKYSFHLFFELMKHDFDIIDVSAFPYFPAFSCKLYSLFKKKPMIITWHEVWYDYWLHYNKLISGFGKAIEKILSKITKNNICVSKLTAKRLNEIGVNKNKIKTIENWIETKEIARAKPLKQEYDIISIGRHLKHKNFDLLLKVCSVLVKEFPQLKVLIIGEGPDTLKLLEIRKKLDLENNVEILSFTKEKEQMYRYLKSSKVFVLLSELEGFSLIAFEAMATSLPVITLESKRNALAGYINGKNGFACKKNEIEIMDAISKLLKE